MVIEIATYRPVPGSTDELAVLDARITQEFAYQQPGILRRTTARGFGSTDGEWVTITLWATVDHAEAARAAWEHHPLAADHSRLVEPGSVTVRRYRDLDDPGI